MPGAIRRQSGFICTVVAPATAYPPLEGEAKVLSPHQSRNNAQSHCVWAEIHLIPWSRREARVHLAESSTGETPCTDIPKNCKQTSLQLVLACDSCEEGCSPDMTAKGYVRQTGGRLPRDTIPAQDREATTEHHALFTMAAEAVPGFSGSSRMTKVERRST